MDLLNRPIRVCLPRPLAGPNVSLPRLNRRQESPCGPVGLGEEHLCSDLTSTAVLRWFKQLRRLQSLCHALRSNSQEPAAVDYRWQLWASICRARGFHWWGRRPVQHHGSPAVIPVAVPSFPVAQLIFTDFRENFRRYESWHASQRRQLLAAKCEQSRLALMRELREPAPDQVHSLVYERTYQVLSVDVATAQVHVEPELDLRGHSQWSLDGCPVTISPVHSTVCQVQGQPSLEEGTELEQCQILSCPCDVQEEFRKVWAPRWGRYPDPDSCDWSRVLQFAHAYIDVGAMQVSAISLSQWKAALRRYKPYAARGPDGFARLDLLHMPDVYTSALLRFLRDVELGLRSWPDQWLEGFVCALHKRNGRDDVHGYRPICLFSIVYRTWSGIRARQCLRFLSEVMPGTAHGFLPHREAAELWLCLEAQIEGACQSQTGLAGFTTDLVKAFNNLPRDPLLEVASRCGIPQDILRPWKSFLNQVGRRFMIRRCVGPRIGSSSGYPEGCPLSTVAMCVANLIYHRYVQVFAPRISSHSFVDNLSTVGHTVADVAQGANLTRCFCDLLGLELDQGKTYVWGTTPCLRAGLRALQLPVLESARELGGLFSFGPRVRNRALKDRCAELQPLFRRLSRSKSPLHFRLGAVPCKLWAKALHGIAGCPVSDGVIHGLRSQAAKALRVHPAGSSALLRLSLCSPRDVDPGYYQLWHTLITFRRVCCKQPQLVGLWQAFQLSHDGTRLHGPFTKLLDLLSQVGWRVLTPPHIKDEEGLTHDLLLMPEALLRRLSERAWLGYVSQQHRHRKTMSDLHGIDVTLAEADVKRLTAVESSLLGSLQSGAFLFGHAHSKFDVMQSGLCAHCGVPDTHKHRVCECGCYAAARAPHQWACDQWDSLPSCLTHHLLVPANPFAPAFRATLHHQPDLTACFASRPLTADRQHLFTDGSCILSEIQQYSVAAWGVVNASSGMVISSGPLGGILQTIGRAELTAALSAIKWAVTYEVPVILWIDALNVARCIHELQAGAFRSYQHADQDLWDGIAFWLQQTTNGQVGVQHVPAHLDRCRCDSPFEEWLACGNQWADTVAVQANLNRSSPQAAVHHQAFQYHLRMLQLLRAYRSMYFHIAEQRPDATRQSEEDGATVDPTQLQPTWADGRGDTLAEQLPLGWKELLKQQTSRMPIQFVVCIFEFLLSQDESGEGPFNVTWPELSALLEFSGVEFPVCDSFGSWVAASEAPFSSSRHTFATSIRLVRDSVNVMLKAFDSTSLRCRGVSIAGLGFSRTWDGLRLRLSVDLLSKEILSEFTATRPTRTAADLARPLRR